MQDSYSVRCIPQIHGASRDTINYVCRMVVDSFTGALGGMVTGFNGSSFHLVLIAAVFLMLGMYLLLKIPGFQKHMRRFVSLSLQCGYTF